MINGNIEEIKKKIEDAFSKFKFHEDGHYYTYLDSKGQEKKIGISTTQFISQYENPFDENKISKFVANNTGMSQEEVLTKWSFDKEVACSYGSLSHLYLENKWNNDSFFYDKNFFIKKFGYDAITPKFEEMKPALDAFYEKFKERLYLIGVEVVIASVDYNIAGSIDLLAYSKKLDSIVIIDNKTNKEIKKKGYKGNVMLSPLNNLQDSNFWHYSLQTAIYKKILEYETGIKVSEKKFLIWFDSSEKNFKIIECANLDKEASKILEDRRKDNV